MANRDGKLIERTLKDFSLSISTNGGGNASGEIITPYDLFQIGRAEHEITHVDFTKLKEVVKKIDVNMNKLVEDGYSWSLNCFGGFLFIELNLANGYFSIDVYNDPVFYKDVEAPCTIEEIFNSLIEEQVSTYLFSFTEEMVMNNMEDALFTTCVFERYAYDREAEELMPYFNNAYQSSKADFYSIFVKEKLEPLVLNLICKEKPTVESNYTADEIGNAHELGREIIIHKYFPEGTCVDEQYGQAYISYCLPLEEGGYNIVLDNNNISELDHIGFNIKEQLFIWYNENDE